MDLGTAVLILQDKYGMETGEDNYSKLFTIRLIAEYVEGKL